MPSQITAPALPGPPPNPPAATHAEQAAGQRADLTEGERRRLAETAAREEDA